MDSFAYLINGVLWIILCIPLLKAFTKTIELIKLVRFRSNSSLLSNQSLVTLMDLNNLSKQEFMMWCCHFLGKQGYKDVSIVHYHQIMGDLIVGTKEGKKVYIKPMRAIDYKKANIKINSEQINQLVGIMTKGKIYNGLIITTEKLDEFCNTYLASLPKPYSINILDGDMLVTKYELLNTFALAPR